MTGRRGTRVASMSAMNPSVVTGPGLIVGVDFSETSGCAVREARRLGAVLDVPISLIHIASGELILPWVPDRDTGAWLRRLAIADTEIEMRTGRPWSELARAAAEQQATAIVVGSHGISGYQPLTMGSTASRLTLLAPCPVLIVSPRSVATAGCLRAPGSRRPPLTT
jgi:nucleotide-binding universal stress UspA family protein